MPAIWLLAIVFTLLMAPFIALQAYILVWILGPAIRRAGRKWEEGVLQSQDAWRNKVDGDLAALRRAQAISPAPPPTRAPAPAADRTPTDPDVGAQYTITGKRIR